MENREQVHPDRTMVGIALDADDGAPEFLPCVGVLPSGRACFMFTKRRLCAKCRRETALDLAALGIPA